MTSAANLTQLFESALQHQTAGHLTEAERLYRDVLASEPVFVPALFNLGSVLFGLGSVDEARRCFTQVLELHGDHPDVFSELAKIELGSSHYSEALSYAKRATALSPAEAKLLSEIADQTYNAGFALQGQSRYEEAMRLYDEVLSVLPDHGEAAWGRAICLLGMGAFEAGWKEYEVRYDSRLREPVEQKPNLPFPMWRGEPLAGKRILLIGEQGAGDQIQFIRYAALLSRRGATVELLTDPRLERLLATADGVSRVHTRIAPGAGMYDYWSFLLSLPLHLGGTIETLPRRVPYLAPREADLRRWKERLGTLPSGNLKVGLVWQSGPAKHEWMRHRDVPLDALRALGAIERISYLGLQFGRGAQPAEAFAALHLGEELGDFADNAAAIAQLDVLIAADTASAHLGGALGIPTWIMLPATPDWRWLRGRADSPWYPSVRLFRQQELGDWQPVVERMAHNLRLLTASRA